MGKFLNRPELKYYFSAAAGAIVLGLDQVLRLVARNRTAPWKFGSVEFGFYPNSGAIFSIPVSSIPMISISVAIIAGLAVVMITYARRRDFYFQLGLALMLAAGVANVLDRLLFGAVIDYIVLGAMFPVFNLADLVILAGLALVLWPRKSW